MTRAYTEQVAQRQVGNFYLTAVRWHNDLGSNQPETGIRDLQHPSQFHLCQHFDLSPQEALDEIQWRLECGWCPHETCNEVADLAPPRIKAVLL